MRLPSPGFLLVAALQAALLPAISTPAGAATAPVATATAAVTVTPTVTSLRTWPSPTATRIVFEFSGAVAHVAPDSGLSRSVLITVPDGFTRADDVPATLRVGDGLVDSVSVLAGSPGGRFLIWFHDSTRYRTFGLPAREDRPHRLVVDVSRPGAALEQVARLQDIAALKRSERVRVIAVDAGHGGEDAGARAHRSVGLLEKTVTLGIARALVAELNATPGVRAVLTRDGDYFIPLHDRYRLAEKMKADVFVSIHANSSRRRNTGSGTEVYYLSLRGASDQADADLADLENAADLVGGVPPQAESELVNILYDVKRSSALTQSQLLAETVLDHVATDRRLTSRGVKQAGFVVLKSVEFPSILVETAFINNLKEARLLKSKAFQLQMAKQIATGVRDYFKRAGVGLGEPEATRGGS